MRVIIIGPPGSGKSTQADAFAQCFRIPHISTGDMFREAFKAGTIVGQKAKEFETSGGLVPDELTIEIVGETEPGGLPQRVFTGRFSRMWP